MAEISLETAKALLETGKINQNTYDLLAESAKPMAAAPVTKEERAPASAPMLAQAATPSGPAQPASAPMPQAAAPVAPREPAVAQPAPVLASDVVAQQPQAPAQLQPANIAKGMDQAYNQMQEAAVQGAAAGMKQAAAESAYLQQATVAAEKMEQERLQREAVREQAMKEKTDRLQQAVDQFNSSKIDPDRFWKDRTTGQKILTGVGLFLGAFGQNGNSAVQVVSDAINRDIELQKLDLEKGRVGTSLQGNVLASMRAQFDDERQAEAAARIAALNQVEMKVRSVAAQYRSPQIEAQAKQAYAQLELAKQKEMLAFGKAVQASGAFVAADKMMQDIMTKIPDEGMRNNAIKEMGEFNGIQSSIGRVDKIYKNMIENQSLGSRVGSPLQSKALLDKSMAELFPVVKSIMGEKMSEGDVQNFLKPYVVSFTDSEKVANAKKESLLEALRGSIAGRTPILSGLGIVPKPIKFGAPVK